MTRDNQGMTRGSQVFSSLLNAKSYIITDGAMGTELFKLGLHSGDSPELWNVEYPEKVQKVHTSYLRAGSDVILTNSFGCNRLRLKLHNLEDKTFRLNKAAGENARIAAAKETERTGRVVLVAGSMGPTGELLQPLGAMSIAECEEVFAEQAEGLAASKVDLLWIETMSDLDEASAAIRGAQSICDLPIAVTMSFDTAGRTMMGVTGNEMGQKFRNLGLAAIGANCGNQVTETEAAARSILSTLEQGQPATDPEQPASQYHTTTSEALAPEHTVPPPAPPPSTFTIFKPNAGIPEWKEGELSYSGTPEVLAAYANRAHASRIPIVGGCCGSTPEHIAKISAVLQGAERPIQIPDEHTATEQLTEQERLTRKELNGNSTLAARDVLKTPVQITRKQHTRRRRRNTSRHAT